VVFVQNSNEISFRGSNHMSTADKYEEASLRDQAEARKAAQQTITVWAAIAIGTAAVVVAVLAALTTINIMDALSAAKQGRCT
jgi:phosphoketolase